MHVCVCVHVDRSFVTKISDRITFDFFKWTADNFVENLGNTTEISTRFWSRRKKTRRQKSDIHRNMNKIVRCERASLNKFE